MNQADDTVNPAMARLISKLFVHILLPVLFVLTEIRESTDLHMLSACL